MKRIPPRSATFVKRAALLCLCLFTLSACAPAGQAPQATQAPTAAPTEAAPGPSSAGEAVRLIVLNVGKADALILTLGDRHFLIDAGYDYTFPLVQTVLNQLRIHTLAGVFLTHCDQDHYGGMQALSGSDIQIEAWYAPGLYHDIPKKGHPLVTAAALRGDSVTWLFAGDTLPAGSGEMAVLGPLTLDTDNENNNSLVLEVRTEQGSMLLCGDMKADEEYALLRADAFSACAVVKVAHHGDSEAAGAAFLSRVKPDVAVISTKTADEPDTPDTATLSRLKYAGASVWVTQNTDWGVEITLANGQAQAQPLSLGLAPAPQQIEMTINPALDTVTLVNRGAESADLSGATLYSMRGGEQFAFPAGYTLQPSTSVTVGSHFTEGIYQLLWDEKRVFHKSKRDVCLLLDDFGREVARTDNGFSE